MNGDTRIRQAEPADARAIAEIHVAAWRSAYHGLLPDSTLERLSLEAAEKRWQGRLAEPQGDLLVLSRGKRLVGFVGYGPTQDEGLDPTKVGEIYLLYVAPEEWRKGHGTALLGEALVRLQEDGREEIVLWVLYNNEQAIRFYEAMAFAADGVEQRKRRADGTSMTVARYRRRLAMEAPRQLNISNRGRG